MPWLCRAMPLKRCIFRPTIPLRFLYGENGCEVQLIQADPTTGQWIVKLRGPSGGNLGIHRHYGTVFGFTLRTHFLKR